MSLFNQNNGYNRNSHDKHSHRHTHYKTTKGFGDLFQWGILFIIIFLITNEFQSSFPEFIISIGEILGYVGTGMIIIGIPLYREKNNKRT